MKQLEYFCVWKQNESFQLHIRTLIRIFRDPQVLIPQELC
jgi:hypothetical protein